MRIAISITALLISLFFIRFAGAEELIELKVRGGISHKALLYQSSSPKAAVLAHQSGETMESWRAFANILADRDVASISLSSLTPDDVSAAVRYLEMKNYDNITLIGASLGGGAITQALAAAHLKNVKRVALLSPSTGPAMTSGEIKKLFMVSKADFYKSRAYTNFEEASEPKILIEYEGAEHGQALLKGMHAKNVLNEILKFLGL
jgi:pimeloyl-ACP methyl ester carboxylesterase